MLSMHTGAASPQHPSCEMAVGEGQRGCGLIAIIGILALAMSSEATPRRARVARKALRARTNSRALSGEEVGGHPSV